MHRNYQISNQDLLGRIPKIDEKMQLLTLGLLYSSLDVPKIVEYLLRVQLFIFQQDSRSTSIYCIPRVQRIVSVQSSFCSSPQHRWRMHLFKKVVDTSFLGLKPAGKITRATMTPGAEQNCLEQLIMQLILIAVFSLGQLQQ